MPSALRFVLLSVVPVLAIHSCFAPFLLSETYAAPGGEWLPALTLLCTAVIIPAYLAVLACRVVLRRVAIGIPLGFSMLLGTLALNVFLDYALWGVGSGMFWTPDVMTLVIMRAAALLGLGILIVPPLFALLIRYAFQHFTRKV